MYKTRKCELVIWCKIVTYEFIFNLCIDFFNIFIGVVQCNPICFIWLILWIYVRIMWVHVTWYTWIKEGIINPSERTRNLLLEKTDWKLAAAKYSWKHHYQIKGQYTLSFDALLQDNFSLNLQRNGVSSCKLQEKSPPVILLVCKIITLQATQQHAYI